MMSRMFCLVCLLALLSGCKTKKQEERLYSQYTMDSLSQMLSRQSSYRMLVSDSLHIVRERYDTLGRIVEREVVERRQNRDAVALTEERDSVVRVLRDSVSGQERRTLERVPKSVGSMLLPWWVLVVVAVIVGIFVSIRYIGVRR